MAELLARLDRLDQAVLQVQMAQQAQLALKEQVPTQYQLHLCLVVCKFAFL
jgi:hypothetical protein